MKTGVYPTPSVLAGGAYFSELSAHFRDRERVGSMAWLRYVATPEDVWALREEAQDERNAARAESWATRGRLQ